MARDKERSINPAQQQRKLEKQKQLKKSRAELQAKRNEKLARRNPDRLERQIQDLKALEASGDIKAREKAILEELERDLKAVRKARETLGDNAPKFGNSRSREGENNNHVLGKRRHDGERKFPHRRRESPGSDTDDSVRRIPMPEDTPPPIPREFRRHNNHNHNHNGSHQDPSQQGLEQQDNHHHNLPSKPAPVIESKTTYSSAPQLRDLKKEAVSRFVPDVVRRKQDAVKGGPSGRLLEPEALDRLEAEGYKNSQQPRSPPHQHQPEAPQPQFDHHTTVSPLDQIQAKRLAEEERRFLEELAKQDEGDNDSVAQARDEPSSPPPARHGRHVQIEEVEDQDA
ncbi:hypothetical protein B0A52_05006 [Exophiala mesophila]|uniref:Wbp11/ELF5/Saf1 N-terminal domain-containing protein n=1 Tax=Exophiala mesophila TaxID=212818 RepID=A0A438N730_EXOME|nr:hypothetical protein B0A52_05006 [Exophiala mesophila]